MCKLLAKGGGLLKNNLSCHVKSKYDIVELGFTHCFATMRLQVGVSWDSWVLNVVGTAEEGYAYGLSRMALMEDIWIL